MACFFFFFIKTLFHVPTGLQNIFLLTWGAKYELRVDMEDYSGGNFYALYSSFSLEPESDGYRLRVSGFKEGGAGKHDPFALLKKNKIVPTQFSRLIHLILFFRRCSVLSQRTDVLNF